VVTGGRALAPARPAGRRGWRLAGTILGSVLAALVLVVVAYDIATTPTAIQGRSPLTTFDPETVGRLEQRAWAAYYQRQWPQLFDLMLRMTRGAFGLSLPQAVYASYLNCEDCGGVFARPV
jgi:hypothetical protein